MEPVFWIERWKEGRIAFHEGAANAFLVEHAARLPPGRILVPLCGKAEDLAYLASLGHGVTGVELVEDAVRAFFAEHECEPAVTRRGRVTAYTAGAVTLLAGDLFEVTREDVGPIAGVYDRAAMVALPPDTRSRYVAHLRTLVAPGTPGVLVTLDYPQEQYEGPPFAVTEREVRDCYRVVEQLGERPGQGRIAEAGVPCVERAYLVRHG